MSASVPPALEASLPAAAQVIAACIEQPQLIHAPALSFLKTYLESLGATLPALVESVPEPQEQATPEAVPEAVRETVPEVEAESSEEEDEVDPEVIVEETTELPPAGDADKEPSDADYETAMAAKMAANAAKEAGDFQKAVEEYTTAILAAPSPLAYAYRADCLLRVEPKRPKAAIRDCDTALGKNPDSAKALKIRGKAFRFLGRWEDSARDLRKACQMDFDPETDELRKLVETHYSKIEARERKARIKAVKKAEEDKERKIEEIKARRATAAAAASASATPSAMPSGMGGMPGSGMPAGMEGLMASLMSDPEIQESLKNPKVMAAFQDAMTNPANLQKHLADPEVKVVFDKLMAKMGGGADGMGGP